MFRRYWIALVVVGLLVLPAIAPQVLAQERDDEEKPVRTPDVIYVPTPHEVVAKMLEMAKVTKNDVVYDLGCGDGRIVVAAAKRGCKAFGFDIDPKRMKDSLDTVLADRFFSEIAFSAKRKNGLLSDMTITARGQLRGPAGDQETKLQPAVTIKQADIFELDLSPANVVTLYLLPSLNVKLIPQLEKLKPGSRIVSHDFDMRGVEPDEKVHFASTKDSNSHTIYLWTTPLKKVKSE